MTTLNFLTFLNLQLMVDTMTFFTPKIMHLTIKNLIRKFKTQFIKNETKARFLNNQNLWQIIKKKI